MPDPSGVHHRLQDALERLKTFFHPPLDLTLPSRIQREIDAQVAGLASEHRKQSRRFDLVTGAGSSEDTTTPDRKLAA